MRPTATDKADPFARIAPHYDVLMAGVPYAAWADYVIGLAARADRPILPQTKLLDLATGTGSAALEFAARGCFVTGIDCSDAMLAEARRKTAREGYDISFISCDLADFRLPAAFDHAVCLYDSLNYILEPERLKQAFANVMGALKTDGLFMFDVNTVRALEAEMFTQSSGRGAAVEYRWKSKYDAETRTSRIDMRFQIRASGERFTIVHYQRAYTDEEIRSFLGEAGFNKVTAYEAYATSPPGPQSDRVFYVASRSLGRGHY